MTGKLNDDMLQKLSSGFIPDEKMSEDEIMFILSNMPKSQLEIPQFRGLAEFFQNYGDSLEFTAHLNTFMRIHKWPLQRMKEVKWEGQIIWETFPSEMQETIERLFPKLCE